MRHRFGLGSIRTVFEYMLVFFIIVGNASMLLLDKAYNVPSGIIHFGVIAAAVIATVINFLKNKGMCRGNDILKAIVLLIIVVLSIGLPGINVVSGLISFAMPVFFLVIYCMTAQDSRAIWIKFANVMIVFAVVSLVLYLIGTVLGLIEPSRIAYYEWGVERSCPTYFGIQYNSQRSDLGFISSLDYRNCGFFPEAPMYNILLCMATCVEYSFRKERRYWRIAVFVLTIITTMTTTGLIFLMFFFTATVLLADRGRQVFALKVLALPLLLVIAAFVGLAILESKSSSILGAGSLAVRFDHLNACTEAFLDYPFFGCGYANEAVIEKYMHYKQGISIGLPSLFAQSGLFAGVLYLVPAVFNIYKCFRCDRKQIVFWIGVLLCYILTAITYRYLMMFLMASQLMWKFDKCRKIKPRMSSNVRQLKRRPRVRDNGVGAL